jgi:hypothetical protein
VMRSPHSPTNEGVLAWLHNLAEGGFWGSLTLKFEAGRVTHIRKEENIKPEELSGTPRSTDENSHSTIAQ